MEEIHFSKNAIFNEIFYFRSKYLFKMFYFCIFRIRLFFQFSGVKRSVSIISGLQDLHALAVAAVARPCCSCNNNNHNNSGEKK